MPQIFTDVRTSVVSSDRRNDAWSPGNDTVAQMQQDLADIRTENRLLQTPGVPPVVRTPRQAAFITTKVPRFGETTSWEQYRQVFDAIVLSNGWDDATAALQRLSHLEGDALNVALLVPMSRRTSRTVWCPLPTLPIFKLKMHQSCPVGASVGSLTDFGGVGR